eukprot:11169110-Lingulodinium_polyedra.AAC.1
MFPYVVFSLLAANVQGGDGVDVRFARTLAYSNDPGLPSQVGNRGFAKQGVQFCECVPRASP